MYYFIFGPSSDLVIPSAGKKKVCVGGHKQICSENAVRETGQWVGR